MTLLHVGHALAVGGLLTGATVLADAALRGAGRPTRGLWMVALVATVAAPFWGPAIAGPAATEGATAPAVFVDGVAANGPVATSSLAARLQELAAAPLPALGWAWLMMAAIGTVVLVGGLVRLDRRAKRWPRAKVEGEDVSISRGFGPAVVGLRHPRTVLPGWILQLPRRDVRVVLAHERSHREAGDAAVLAVGLGLAALCPWNPWVWFQFGRLRDTTEMDCDRRLVAKGVPVPTYARVLVKVRLRGASAPGLVAPLVESPSSLERRLKTMNAFPWSRPRVAGTVLAALGLVVVACETPAPSAVTPDAEPEYAASEIEVPVTDVVEVEEIPVDASAGSLRLRAAEGQPLVIIDGKPSPGAVFDLASQVDAENIERVEVIKGAAAIAIYGEEASNGVVSITTVDGERTLELPLVELREEPIYDEVVTAGTLRLRPDRSGGNR
jgi:TonB-dependent SusC/RagA subfamily outer membrane receptor